MPKINIVPFHPQMREEWDGVVVRSKNGNFMHLRDYIDYNLGKFNECSVMIYKGCTPVAVFPCNSDGDELISYSGLPYAGLIYGTDLKAIDILQIFTDLIEHYKQGRGKAALIYKAIPHLFHRYPAEEDLYALYCNNAKLLRRDISSVVPMKSSIKLSKGRMGGVRKALKNDLFIKATNDISSFWELLSKDLGDRHKVQPTHRIDEMNLLRTRFPNNIILFCAYRVGCQVPLAGALIYLFGNVIHTQYLASSEEGRMLGALDFLISRLVDGTLLMGDYLSFGISTERCGLILNHGLIFQKEGFGARAVVHDFYSLEL